MGALEKLIERIKEWPEARITELQQIVDELEPKMEPCKAVTECIYCGSASIVRNGHKHGKQAYLCRKCGKSFVETTNTIMYHSHYGQEIWKQVIKDTLNHKSIDKTARELGMDHHVVFNMRHKILQALEKNSDEEPSEMGGVSEFDETFVLESYKGCKTEREKAGREARKHGAKASKPGISTEYICICAGVQRDGVAFSHTVNRAKPSNEEIQNVFQGHIEEKTLILCDGLQGYQSLEKIADCTVANVHAPENKGKGFYNLNTVNNYHSFIKTCYRDFRGVATKYLNRYNALFSTAYRCCASKAESIYHILSRCGPNQRYHSNRDVKEHNLLLLPG